MYSTSILCEIWTARSSWGLSGGLIKSYCLIRCNCRWSDVVAEKIIWQACSWVKWSSSGTPLTLRMTSLTWTPSLAAIPCGTTLSTVKGHRWSAPPIILNPHGIDLEVRTSCASRMRSDISRRAAEHNASHVALRVGGRSCSFVFEFDIARRIVEVRVFHLTKVST